MAKIAYSVSGEGQGHAARARTLIEDLGDEHEVLLYAPGRAHQMLAPLLGRYSFPSGHTQHAVAFSLVILAHYPTIAWFLVPFTVFVAMWRVILYPSDVLAGATLGALLGQMALVL